MKTKKELTEELVLRIQELLKQFDNSNISKNHYYLIEVCEVFDEIKISTPGNYFTAVFIDALHQAIVTKHICFNFRANKFFTGIVISLGYYHIEKEFS